MMDTFSLRISELVEKAKGNVELVVRKVALDVFGRVIQKSPVDTGRFKGNWQPQIMSIPDGILDIKDKSGGLAMGKVAAEVSGMKAGQIIYMVNNLPYSVRLEYGYSKQAPEGMVRLTILEYGGIVNDAASQVKE